MATTASTAPAREGNRAAQVPFPPDPTLDLLSAVPQLKDRLYGAVRPYLHGLVLETGSGEITFAEQLLSEGREVYLSDPRVDHCHRLRKRFALLSHCRGVLPLDLGGACFRATYPHLFGQCGTVLAINVLQQIGDDRCAVANAFTLLRPGGKLIVLVPAPPLTLARTDRTTQTPRRYTRRELRALFDTNDLDTVRSIHLNLASVPGRRVPAGLSQDGPPTPRPVTWWGRLVPLIRPLERLAWRGVGLSVLAVGRARPARTGAVPA